MNILSRLVKLEKSASEAGLLACPHCRDGVIRVRTVDLGDGGPSRYGYSAVIVREWLDAEPGDRVRDPLDHVYKQNTVGWRDDDSWDLDALRCRWCGRKVEYLCLVGASRPVLPTTPMLPTEPLVTPIPEQLNGICPHK